jgi:hypothetical protein
MGLNVTGEKLTVPRDGKYIMFLIMCGTGKDCPTLVVCLFVCVFFPFPTRSSPESNESR